LEACQIRSRLPRFRRASAASQLQSNFILRTVCISVYCPCNHDRRETTCILAVSCSCLTQWPSNLQNPPQCTARVLLVSFLYLQSPSLRGDSKEESITTRCLAATSYHGETQCWHHRHGPHGPHVRKEIQRSWLHVRHATVKLPSPSILMVRRKSLPVHCTNFQG